ncbi:MAG TPA: hypothetical protein VFS21_09055 [Roseiflexaceae bacterium]|nr:hypothetical protein [Roseiflexaceae bacterium]
MAADLLALLAPFAPLLLEPLALVILFTVVLAARDGLSRPA